VGERALTAMSRGSAREPVSTRVTMGVSQRRTVPGSISLIAKTPRPLASESRISMMESNVSGYRNASVGGTALSGVFGSWTLYSVHSADCVGRMFRTVGGCLVGVIGTTSRDAIVLERSFILQREHVSMCSATANYHRRLYKCAQSTCFE